MGLKDIKHFTAEEVGMWLTAQGLGEEAPKFVDEGEFWVECSHRML